MLRHVDHVAYRNHGAIWVATKCTACVLGVAEIFVKWWLDLAVFNAVFLDKVAAGAEAECNILGEGIVGLVPARILEKAKSKGGEMLTHVRGFCQSSHQTIPKHSFLEMATEAVGVRRLIFESYAFHRGTIKVVASDLPHGRRYYLEVLDARGSLTLLERLLGRCIYILFGAIQTFKALSDFKVVVP